MHESHESSVSKLRKNAFCSSSAAKIYVKIVVFCYISVVLFLTKSHPPHQIAGNAVKHASEDLVKAASESANSDEEVEVVINDRLVRGIAQEMMAQEEILRKERELATAREKLAQIRRFRYRGDESD